jgi:predicted trehalose synthase
MDINQNGKDDIQEIKDGFAQLVADAKALNPTAVITDLKNGAAWTVNYVEALCEEAQTIFNAVITKVKAESSTLGEAVANALTLLNNPSLHSAFGAAQDTIAQLVAISSQVITKVLSLLTGLEAAVGA